MIFIFLCYQTNNLWSDEVMSSDKTSEFSWCIINNKILEQKRFEIFVLMFFRDPACARIKKSLYLCYRQCTLLFLRSSKYWIAQYAHGKAFNTTKMFKSVASKLFWSTLTYSLVDCIQFIQEDKLVEGTPTRMTFARTQKFQRKTKGYHIDSFSRHQFFI